VSAGDAIGLIGPSGCGKSTLLDLVALILRPTALRRLAIADSGRQLVELDRVARHGTADRLAYWRSRLIGYVLQTGGIVPFATVRENIALPRWILGLPDRGVTAALAKRLEIDDLLDRWPDRLSVGQRQRVAVARAVAHQPPLIIADEPTASLDPDTGDLTMQLLIDTCRDFAATLIVSTHDVARAAQFNLRPLAFAPAEGRARFAYPDPSTAPE
jgi:putative ABC transport system ATP-binding protein